MNDIASLLKKDEVKEFSESDLGFLASAVNAMLSKQKEIDVATEELKLLSAQHRKINEETIPDLMDDLGFATITLKDGRAVAVKDSIQASIKVADRPTAFAWMVENNHGDLIKSALSAKFSRGEKADAVAAVNALQAMGITASLTESVHPGTLKAWARVELEQGHILPPSIGIHVSKQTTVK